MNDRQTSNCIVCLKPTVWVNLLGCILRQDGERVMPGFCDEHRDTVAPNLLNIEGCYGGYHNEYGCKRRKNFERAKEGHI